MFFIKRKDGKRIKKMDPLFKIIPNIMEERSDAQVYYEFDLPITEISKYIREKREQGINVRYMHVIFAAIIRVFKERPYLNRFVMQNRMFQREEVSSSLVVKKDLKIDGEEAIVKEYFTGDENLLQIKEKLDKEIEYQKNEGGKELEKLVKILNLIPAWLSRFAVKLLMFLDRRDLMPNAVVKASPFHASFFVTNVGSIGLSSIYHHIYNFGTIGMFVSIGKKKSVLEFKDNTIKQVPHIPIAIVADERICDGYYFASSLKLIKTYLLNPYLLDKTLPELNEERKIQEEEKRKRLEKGGFSDIKEEKEEDLDVEKDLLKKSFLGNIMGFFRFKEREDTFSDEK